jgi:NADP-dependent 3-hydroxy acid dehydrogenase YdfG
MPLGNRIVLTGAAGGIGRVMTRALLDEGHSVAAVDRDAEALERLKNLVPAAERLCPMLADLSTEAGCMQAMRSLCPDGLSVIRLLMMILCVLRSKNHFLSLQSSVTRVPELMRKQDR